MTGWGNDAWGQAGWGNGITVTNKAASSVQSSVSSFVTGSVAFQNDTLYTISVGINYALATAKSIDSVTGGGLTWTLIAQAPAGSNAGINPRCAVFEAYATSGATTGTLSVTLSGTVTNYAYSIDEWTGVDVATPFVQSNTRTSTPVGSFGNTVTLAAFADAVDNVTFGAFAVTTNTAVVVDTTPAGYRALSNPRAGTGTSVLALLAEYNTGEDLAVAATWPSDPSYSSVVALEISANTVAPDQGVAPGLIDQGAVPFDPVLLNPQTVTAGFVDQTSTTFAPKLTWRITVGLVDQGAVTFTPGAFPQFVQLGSAFQLDAFQNNAFQAVGATIDQHGVAIAPHITMVVNIPGIISSGGAFQADAFQNDAFQVGTGTGLDQSATTFAPLVSPVVAGANTVFTTLIDQHGFAIAPRLPTTVGTPLLDQHATVFTPGGQGYIVSFGGSVNWDSPDVVWDDPGVVWDASGTGSGILDRSATTFAPAATISFTVGLIDQHATLFAPQTGLKTVTTPLIDQTPIIFQFSTSTLVSPDIIDNSAELFEFQTGSLEYDLIDQSADTFAPQINVQYVFVDLLDNSPVIFECEVQQQVTTDLLDNSAETFAPFVGEVVFAELIDQEAVTFIPSLERVMPDLLDQAAATFGPEVIQQTPQSVRLDDLDSYFLDASAVTFTPEVDLAQPRVILVGFIDQTAIVFIPRIVVPTRNILQLRARYEPIIRNTARYDPVIDNDAMVSQQG